MTAVTANTRSTRSHRRPITFGLVGRDGTVITWSREDPDNVCGQGSFSGDRVLIDQVTAILLERTPVVLPTEVVWTFLPAPQLRPADVAAAMIAAIQVDSDIEELLRKFPELQHR